MVKLGEFRWELALLKPSAPKRDEMGGRIATTYSIAGRVKAKQRDKTSSYRQVIGDYVTVDTSYFVLLGCVLEMYPIDNRWRFTLNKSTYAINKVTLLDEKIPVMVELEATKIGGTI